MRRAAWAMLAASSLAGCNWVFGLDETHAAPDAPDAPPPGVPIHLALLNETLDVSGNPQAPVEVAMTDVARIEAGLLANDTTQPLTAGADGMVPIPSEIFESQAWRFIYQRAGGPVMEYQNLPAEAHVVETVLGPIGAPAPSANSGYLIMPSGHPGGTAHAINRVYTTGTWTEGTKSLAPAGSTLDYDLPGAVGLAGPVAAPSGTDHGVLLDYAIDGASGCLGSTGSVDFPAGMPGPPKEPVTGTWDPVRAAPIIDSPTQLVLTNAVAPFGEPDRAAREQYGVLAAFDVPLFLRPPDANRSLFLRNPPLVLLRSCPLPVTAPTVNVNRPSYLSRFKQVVHTELSASRQLGNATLTNGIAILTLDDGGTYDVMTTAGVAKAIQLGGTDLFGASDDVPFTGTGPITAMWDKMPAVSTGQATASFWQVALIELTASGPVRRRVYVTTKQSVVIMRKDLTTSSKYVLEVTAFTGRPGAAAGDFRTVSNDQAIATINSRSFVVQ